MSTFLFGSHSVITGGTFTQVNNNVLAQSSQNPWDCLKSAVAPAAFHNSAERFDPPRCHPNTRVAVMDELRDLALRRGDAARARILWLSGPAGAGKSAIAQSFCEECYSKNLLLASFFFNRSDTSRNHAKSFVATLTYQIYGKVPVHYQSLILDAINNDPLVFERSFDAQFNILVVGPLQGLFETNYFVKGVPSVVVIDGLDECATGAVQTSLLTALQTISKLPRFPFVFLIASRLEHDIQMFFRSSTLGCFLHRLNLDNSWDPNVDIKRFLEEEIQKSCATHPLKDSIPQGWPSRNAIGTLVWKLSGHFIYASIAVKYVTSTRHYPPNRLEVVLQLRPPKHDLPFAELDAIYSHIFSCVSNITLVQLILRTVIAFQNASIPVDTKDIEQLCELEQGESLPALCDLQSVLHVESKIDILHKSLPDYLQDPTRSHKYHIDIGPQAIIPVVIQCLRCISDPQLDINLAYFNFVLRNLSTLSSNIHLCRQDLKSFSLTGSRQKETYITRQSLFCAFGLLDELCTLEGTEYEDVYLHLLHQFPKLAGQYPQVYGPEFPLMNRNCTFPMIIIFILLGHPDAGVSPKALAFLQYLPFETLGQIPLGENPMRGLQNISCAAAQCCVNSLMCDASPKSAGFALECLYLILPEARLSSDLNNACLLERPFAYAATGNHGLSALALRAQAAMREYRERYAMLQPAIRNDTPLNPFS